MTASPQPSFCPPPGHSPRPAHIAWINDNAGLVGGRERYILNTVRLLRDRGDRSTFFYLPEAPTDPEFLREFDQTFPLASLASALPRLAPDLVYVHHLEVPEVLSALQAMPVPQVLFVHDYKLFCPRENKYTAIGHHTCNRTVGWTCYPCVGFLRRSTHWPGLKLVRVGSFLARQRLYRTFDAIVTGSRHMANHIAAHGFDSARVHAVPLFATPPTDPPPVEREKDLLLFAAQLIRGKGLDVLLRAMPKLAHPAHLVVAGAGRQERLFRRLTTRLGLNDRVQFLGNTNAEQLAALYRRAALVVVPSRYPETFGLVGVEAMSHGAPVVATSVGAIEEWLEDGVTGFAVPPNDSSALASAMDRLLANPTLARDFGANGHSRYQRHFRPEHHVDSLVSLFQQVRAEKESWRGRPRPQPLQG